MDRDPHHARHNVDLLYAGTSPVSRMARLDRLRTNARQFLTFHPGCQGSIERLRQEI